MNDNQFDLENRENLIERCEFVRTWYSGRRKWEFSMKQVWWWYIPPETIKHYRCMQIGTCNHHVFYILIIPLFYGVDWWKQKNDECNYSTLTSRKNSEPRVCLMMFEYFNTSHDDKDELNCRWMIYSVRLTEIRFEQNTTLNSQNMILNTIEPLHHRIERILSKFCALH